MRSLKLVLSAVVVAGLEEDKTEEESDQEDGEQQECEEEEQEKIEPIKVEEEKKKKEEAKEKKKKEEAKKKEDEDSETLIATTQFVNEVENEKNQCLPYALPEESKKRYCNSFKTLKSKWNDRLKDKNYPLWKRLENLATTLDL